MTLAAGDADGSAAAARGRVGDGFAVLKMKVGTDAATDVGPGAAPSGPRSATDVRDPAGRQPGLDARARRCG